jgi:hypothetical protein
MSELIFRTHWTDELRRLLQLEAGRSGDGLRDRWEQWMERGLNSWTSRLLVPAAYWPKERHHLERRRNQLRDQWNGQKWAIVTADGVQLDTMFFPAPSQPKKRATVIYFGGNAESYETNPFVIPMVLEELGCNLVTFNYRQVGESDGQIDGPGMLIDGYCMLQAVDQLLLPDQENRSLILHGRSIGGAVATSVAATYQGGKRVAALCSERSFSSLDLVMDHIAAGTVGSRITRWMIRRSRWHFEPRTLWEQIQGHKIVIFHRRDTIIPYPASLHHSLSHEERSQITAIELHQTFGIEPHNTPFYAPQSELYDKTAFALYQAALSPLL